MTIQLATDGSAVAYANCGGWAFVKGDTEKGTSGACWAMGPNQMELMAIIKALEDVNAPSEITIYTDSNYVIAGVKKRRHRELNLWIQLYHWLQIHKVTFVKVGKGFPNKLHKQAHNLAREAVFYAVRTKRLDHDDQRATIPLGMLRASG